MLVGMSLNIISFVQFLFILFSKVSLRYYKGIINKDKASCIYKTEDSFNRFLSLFHTDFLKY